MDVFFLFLEQISFHSGSMKTQSLSGGRLGSIKDWHRLSSRFLSCDTRAAMPASLAFFLHVTWRDLGSRGNRRHYSGRCSNWEWQPSPKTPEFEGDKERQTDSVRLQTVRHCDLL